MTRAARHLFARLTDLPRWGLFRDGVLLATVRAPDLGKARELFDTFGFAGKSGDRVRPYP
jgi:hypothetical protein